MTRSGHTQDEYMDIRSIHGSLHVGGMRTPTITNIMIHSFFVYFAYTAAERVLVISSGRAVG